MNLRLMAIAALCILAPDGAWAICPYDVNCLNNPYGGRDDSAPTFNAAPYGRGQGGAAFSANPLRGGVNDPYAPPAPSEEELAPKPAPAPGGLGLSPPQDGMQGLDPDQAK